MLGRPEPLVPLSRNTVGWVAIITAVMAGCGGADADPAVAVGQVAAAGATAGQNAAVPQQADDTVGLVREVFTYVGSGRDPFRSLVEGDAGLRPFLEDLRVVSILYDARYPVRSVAVLRDVAVDQRYQVRVGDDFGRLRVAEIRQNEVVLTLEAFGQSRQVVLPVGRQEDDS